MTNPHDEALQDATKKLVAAVEKTIAYMVDMVGEVPDNKDHWESDHEYIVLLREALERYRLRASLKRHHELKTT